MGNNFHQEWINQLENRFGKVNEIKSVKSEDNPEIYVLFFEDLPEKGTLTSITCGLSNANHGLWKYGKPELILSLDTSDKGWGLSSGYFASCYFNEKPFQYGDVFKLDYPISNESLMNGFLVFAPSFLKATDAKFDLSDRVINLVGMYPIYDEEIEYYKKVGLEKFWHSEGLDFYNPNRKKIVFK